MSIIDELKKWTHPYEDEDEEFEDFEEPPHREPAFDDRKTRVEDRRNKVVNIHATTQLKVVLVKPERFENASEIADNLKDKRTVVLNLESTNKDVARRLIDFLSGVAYAGEVRSRRWPPIHTSSRPTPWTLRATSSTSWKTTVSIFKRIEKAHRGDFALC